MGKNFRLTRTASYMSCIIQAAVITLIPLLFIPIKNDLGLSYMSLATLLSINFITQLITDLALSRAADKYGFKPFVLLADVLIFFGFIVFAAAPDIFPNHPYIGFVIGTVLYSVGGGLEEILGSPLINALPSKSKTGSMAFLHSSYGIGQMLCIAGTSLFIYFAGEKNWQITVACWAVLPVINFFMFLFAPFPETSSENCKVSRIGKTVVQPEFILCMLIIFFGAGVENTMVQWSSAYMEKALSLPKLLGDSLGILMFALMLTICRLIFGIKGQKLNLSKSMLIFSLCAVFCYISVAFTQVPAAGLIACALTGFFAAMLWPGTLILADESFPGAGAWLFAFMAFGGDCGAAFCPWLTGLFTDNAYKIPFLRGIMQSTGMTNEQLGLRTGMAISILYPALTALFIALYIISRKKKRN